MDETTLNGHLLELSRSLDDYRAAVKKAQEHFAFEVEALWDDQAALRDELHESVTALSNRIAEASVAAGRGGVFACNPDESGGVRNASQD